MIKSFPEAYVFLDHPSKNPDSVTNDQLAGTLEDLQQIPAFLHEDQTYTQRRARDLFEQVTQNLQDRYIQAFGKEYTTKM